MRMRNVEDTLRCWQQWDVPWSSPPRLERELVGGSTNQSYLITADDRQWVLRLNAEGPINYGIDRKHEAAVIARASAAGVAPAIAYCSIERGVLVTEFIDGQHWQPQALSDSEHLTRLLRLVRSVHTLEIDIPAIDYYAHAERYWTELIAAKVDIPPLLRREREQLLEQQALNPVTTHITHLCHHDLSPSNIVDRNGLLYLLDWEYAAHGSRAFDYACIATEWDISIGHLKKHVDIGLEELGAAVNLYRYICRLWQLSSLS